METVEIVFEEVRLVVTYKWFEEHCNDLNLNLDQLKDEDIYIYIYITYVNLETFQEIDKRYFASNRKTLCWLVIASIGNECFTSSFDNYNKAIAKKNELELKGYTTCIHYGYK